MRTSRLIILTLATFFVVAVTATDGFALRYQPRLKWLVGVGYGIGRGQFTGAAGQEYRNGASPHIRVGRMIGEHMMISANYEGWLIEFGNEGPNASALSDTIKVRRMMQTLGVGFSFFPGSQHGPLNGLYFRVGTGMGWTGTGAKVAVPDEEQHSGERIDEWGIGFFGESGYEFWVARNFTAGLGLIYNYYIIEADIVDKAWYTAALLNLNLYF